ncbi:MAG: peptidase S53 propeptide, partial [Planctomycetaceae bacterium]
MFGRKVFRNSVVALDDETQPGAGGLIVNASREIHKSERLDFVFSLSIPQDLRARLEGQVLQGTVVDPHDLVNLYGPRREHFDALIRWLKNEGLEATHITPDQTSVYVRGTVRQIEKSLAVKMVRVTKDGLTYNATKDAPSLPAEVAEGVQAVVGLQPFRNYTKKSRQRAAPFRNSQPDGGGAPPYLVKDVLKAYNAENLAVTGAGQTIAILIDRLPLDADTEHFWIKNGLPVVTERIEKINVPNTTLAFPDDGEESMDVQWSSGIAPGARVRVYASGSFAFVDLDRALDRILEDAANDPGLRQLSISIGLGEEYVSPDGSLAGEIEIEHDKFLKLAALGVNVFVSSGDGGSSPDQFGRAGGQQQTEWMASSPFVIAVGGTTLHLGATGEVTSETGWAGSGGGISKVFGRPAYQNRPGMPPSARRLVPDVSLVASPETGAYVRVNGNDREIGGTSLSAPIWAAFCALLNESRTKANQPTLPFLNPIIYPLLGTDCFRDITGGSNNGDFTTDPGYDMVTGIGVPNVRNLMNRL